MNTIIVSQADTLQEMIIMALLGSEALQAITTHDSISFWWDRSGTWFLCYVVLETWHGGELMFAIWTDHGTSVRSSCCSKSILLLKQGVGAMI